MDIPDRCKCITNDSKIVVEEHLSKITFINTNRSHVIVIQVDGCVITEGIRCDSLVLDACQKEHYVELKGSDVDHAVAQLERTIEMLSVNIQRSSKCSFIISTRCPLTSPKIQELKLKFKRKYNSTLIIKNKYHEHAL